MVRMLSSGQGKPSQVSRNDVPGGRALFQKNNHSLRATGATMLFSAGVPEKLIRDVTGHTSNALELDERPSVAQKAAVSGILVQGRKSFVDEVDKENSATADTTPMLPPLPTPPTSATSSFILPPCATSGSNVACSLFSGLNNCTLNISPQNFIVNVSPPAVSHAQSVDGLLQGIQLEDLL